MLALLCLNSPPPWRGPRDVPCSIPGGATGHRSAARSARPAPAAARTRRTGPAPTACRPAGSTGCTPTVSRAAPPRGHGRRNARSPPRTPAPQPGSVLSRPFPCHSGRDSPPRPEWQNRRSGGRPHEIFHASAGAIDQGTVAADDGPERHEVGLEREVVRPLEPDRADQADHVLREVAEEHRLRGGGHGGDE